MLAGGIWWLLKRPLSQTTPPLNVSASPAATPNMSKLAIEDIKEGIGDPVKSGDTVVVNYKGALVDGTVFDSSYDRGQPFSTQIGVGAVIKGWDEGIVGMRAGGKRKLSIPSELGYGSRGAGPIPPNSDLIFEVELVEIK